MLAAIPADRITTKPETVAVRGQVTLLAAWVFALRYTLGATYCDAAPCGPSNILFPFAPFAFAEKAMTGQAPFGWERKEKECVPPRRIFDKPLSDLHGGGMPTILLAGVHAHLPTGRDEGMAPSAGGVRG